MATPFKARFTLTDAALEIYPNRPAIERALTYNKREMVVEPRASGRGVTRKSVNTPVSLIRYRKLDAHGLERIWVPQGLWRYLFDVFESHGWQIELVDNRLPFPKPNLRAIHGLRYNQHEKLVSFLSQNLSGMFDAPTRYGKAYLILNTIRAYQGVKTGVVIPGKDLGTQTYEFLQKHLGVHREVRMIGFGSKHKFPSEDVTIYSLASLAHADFSTSLLILDEVHAIATDPRLSDLERFTKARRLGFGATTSGRYDKRDIEVQAYIGPVLTSVTYREARDLGAVDHLIVFMVDWPYDVTHCRTRDKAYKDNLLQSGRVARFLKEVFTTVIPPDWQTIGFISSEASADFFAKAFHDEPSVAMAKKFENEKQRHRFLYDMQQGKITRCLASNIYSQGVTFSDLRVVINLMGGGANTYAIQKPGRVLEVRPGKKCGVMIDFMLRAVGDLESSGGNPAWAPHQDSKARLNLYTEKGYEVIHVANIDELRTVFQQRCI